MENTIEREEGLEISVITSMNFIFNYGYMCFYVCVLVLRYSGGYRGQNLLDLLDELQEVLFT